MNSILREKVGRERKFVETKTTCLDDFFNDDFLEIYNWTNLTFSHAKLLIFFSRTFIFVAAFGLNKLMVPVMIGVQIVKSVLFAMFLPSLLGNLGRVVGEGVKYLSSQGYGRHPNDIGGHMGQMEDFEFKVVLFFLSFFSFFFLG